MTSCRMLVAAAMVSLTAVHASADALTDATQGLCDTMKSCALEAMTEKDLSAEQREEFYPMLDSMCADMRNKVKAVPAGHSLYQPAVDCVRSLESLTCEQLQDVNAVETTDCNEYERLAKKAEAAAK